jgi:hypothetical protein
MIVRTLQAFFLACAAVGLWHHDWVLIVASLALLAMLSLIGEDVKSVA